MNLNSQPTEYWNMKLKTNRLKKVIENNSSQPELIRQIYNPSHETKIISKKANQNKLWSLISN
jgi:hypothetical protein